MDQEREAAYKHYFYEQLADTSVALPVGMTPSAAFALAKEKAKSGGNYFMAMDKIFEEGALSVKQRHQEKSDYLMAKNAELLVKLKDPRPEDVALFFYPPKGDFRLAPKGSKLSCSRKRLC